jgi:acyl carrier protein
MKEKLLEIINTVRRNADMPALNEIKSDMNLRDDLELDSLNLAELTVRIKDEFDVDIFEDGLIQFVGEIENKLNEKAI